MARFLKSFQQSTHWRMQPGTHKTTSSMRCATLVSWIGRGWKTREKSRPRSAPSPISPRWFSLTLPNVVHATARTSRPSSSPPSSPLPVFHNRFPTLHARSHAKNTAAGATAQRRHDRLVLVLAGGVAGRHHLLQVYNRCVVRVFVRPASMSKVCTSFKSSTSV